MTKLEEAKALLELWMDPLKVECAASAHQNDGNILSCTCRNVEIRTRTREFLGRCRTTPGE